MHRRDFLRASAVSLAFGGFGPEAHAAVDAPRFVFVILRGGLDGLHAVPAVGDPRFASARGAMGEFATAPLALDGMFALHPMLPTLHAWYGEKQLAILHAVGLPYRQRSHFDAQNVLETGGVQPFALKDGWLNRALFEMRSARDVGLALSPTIPLVLQGRVQVDNWAGARIARAAPDTLARIARLYASDQPLATAWSRASAVVALDAGEPPVMDVRMDAAPVPGAAEGPAGRGPLIAAAREAAARLAAPSGPRVAVIESGGFDSHSGQSAPQGALARTLGGLDRSLATLREGLGAAVWSRTVVVIATEFGRTVRGNGTGGTDHGVGTVAFVAGGAVRGGRMVTDWPGLAGSDLLDGRDLRPTRDLRAVLKGVLSEHLRIDRVALDTRVFPESHSIAPLDGLVS